MKHPNPGSSSRYELVLLFAAVIYMGGILSPPSLMDDVDGVQAQVARTMLESGDWVTPHLDGVPVMEKSPLNYWMMAACYALFGVHDWAARIPVALAAIALCWLTARFAGWAFSARAGLYAGIALATCVGLFLFTRIQIPDVMVTFTVAMALWALLRLLDENEAHPRRWAMILGASLGAGLLLKSLIAVVFPMGAAGVYLLLTRQLFHRKTWQRLHPFTGLATLLVIAAPRHLLATLRNPPYFDFTLQSWPTIYRGFFWSYFINEQVLRFLDLRHPHDYNTVPPLWFWLLQLVWLFPWSVFFPALLRLCYRPVDRAGRVRLLALCWIGFVMLFFTFSTTQEYYSMPIYPALALLLGSAMIAENRWLSAGRKIVGTLALAAAVAIGGILFLVRGVATPGDIAQALTQNPELYTFSLGHMSDLTLSSFAYLRMPLLIAGVALLLGGVMLWRFEGHWAYLAMALMMVVFLQAAQRALAVFDPYLSSRPLATALSSAPPGRLILDGQYFTFSSVFFYTNRRALLWSSRVNNLEYGSYAPGAPQVHIGDDEFRRLWAGPERQYLLAEGGRVSRVRELAGSESLHLVAESGGKFLFTNHALAEEHGRRTP